VLKCIRFSSPNSTVHVYADAVKPKRAITAAGKAANNIPRTLQRSRTPHRAAGCLKAAEHSIDDTADAGEIHDNTRSSLKAAKCWRNAYYSRHGLNDE
jgi:hypothetical protein